jgi:hypothetical protein
MAAAGCEHEWVSADLDVGGGDQIEECAKCGTLRYVCDESD